MVNPPAVPPPIPIGDLLVDGVEPVFLLGPCVIESEEFVWEMARGIAAIAEARKIRFVFKASYDKANRTSGKSFRGPGIEEGCRILGEIGRELGVPVTTDIHSPDDAEIAAEHIDLLQIPAFLCRQTDLLLAAAATGRTVNIKKGQFLAPGDVGNIVEKLEAAGNPNCLVTERGTTFGYNNLVVDMRSLAWMRAAGIRVIFDATHSVQRPGGDGTSTGGDREMAPVLARAAVAAGCDGVFMETHTDPGAALSDGPNQVPLDQLDGILQSLTRIHDVVAA